MARHRPCIGLAAAAAALATACAGPQTADTAGPELLAPLPAPSEPPPVLAVALRMDVGYVGAMGSRRTHDHRLERLREVGLTEPELARLASPIGLDLGARTPEETAVSIAAEMISLRWGGRGSRLSEVNGPIHASPLVAR